MHGENLDILIIGPDPGGMGALEAMLRAAGIAAADVVHAGDLPGAARRLRRSGVGLIIADLDAAGMALADLTALLDDLYHGASVIAVGGIAADAARHTGGERWVDALSREEATDAALCRAIRAAAEHRRAMRLERQLRDSRTEMKIARSIQEQLLPWVPPALRRGQVAGASIPAETVSGDYFDYLTLRGGRFAIAVGDASGHGLGPAILMAETRVALHALALSHDDPGRIITGANRLLSGSMPDSRFVSLFLCSFDERMSRMCYSSAGHPAAYLLNERGRVRMELAANGFPLGISHEPAVTDGPIDIGRGDLLLVLTDGILEARSGDEALFGADRVLDIVRVLRDASPLTIVNALTDAVRDHCAPALPQDDVTAVVMKFDV